MRKVTPSIIAAAAVIIAAVIGLYPHLRNPQPKSTLAGIVQEQGTKRAIGQASIALAGRTEQYLTDDSGNFRIDLPAQTPRQLRLHVSKAGFQPIDIAVEPAENLVLQMQRR